MFLRITKVSCIATEDTVGTDDLYVIIGPDSYSLGTYSAGSIRTDILDQVVPAGVTEATFAEKDFPDPDDVLGAIDLTQEMDVDRVLGIMEGSARYDISFLVVSEPGDRCSSICPTCGGQCRRAGHDGTVHWCGQHEWGAN